MFSLFAKEYISREFYKKYIESNSKLFIDIVGLEMIEYVKSCKEYSNFITKINWNIIKIKSKLVK